VAATGLAVVDVAHWASEWPWLTVAAHRLRDDVQRRSGMSLQVAVSARVTDPWRLHA
jgi:hypothetical protein